MAASSAGEADAIEVLVAAVSVVFDVDVGQRVDAVFPEGALLPEEERQVAFHAFPDSMSFELHARSSVRDSQFHFRLPRAPPARGALYGHVFCRQRCDERLRRGGEQRAVVLLSAHPLGAVLAPLVRAAGPQVMAYGGAALAAVWDAVAAWPPLRWGASAALPLGAAGAPVAVDLPDLTTLPLDAPLGGGGGGGAGDAGADAAREAALAAELDPATGLPLCLLGFSTAGGDGDGAAAAAAAAAPPLEPGPFPDVDVYSPLRPHLERLWALWEMVLLGEPLLVAAPHPGAAAAAVAALASLAVPFPPAADFRPYFTIHDPACARLAGGAGAGAGAGGLPALLGVTNPYFLKALPDWPNVLSTGYTAASQPPGGDDDAAAAAAAAAARRAPPGGGRRLGGLLPRRRPAGAAALLSAPDDAAWLSYRPLTRPDRGVLAALVHAGPADSAGRRARAAELNTAALRAHFQELTRALLFPLLPYVSPAPPPAARGAEALRRPAPLPPLRPAAVLAGLGDRAGAVPAPLLRAFGSHKALAAFYERFLEGAPLRAWLAERRAVAAGWQRRRWRAALAAAGAGAPPEVVAVERFFAAERAFEAAAAAARGGGGAAADGGSPGGGEAARASLRSAFDALPEDLRASLLLSPAKRELLGAPPEGGGANDENVIVL